MSFRSKLADWIFPQPKLSEESLEPAEALELDDVKWADVMRDQLKGVTVNTAFIDEMSHDERIDFCEKADDVLKNPTFKRTLDYLISLQVDVTVKRAGNMNEVLFGRATINGLSLVREEFERLAALAEEERNKPKKMTKDEQQEVI